MPLRKERRSMFNMFVDPGFHDRSFAWVTMPIAGNEIYDEYGIIPLGKSDTPIGKKLQSVFSQLLLILRPKIIKEVFIEDTVFYYSMHSVAAIGSGAIMRVANVIGVTLLAAQLRSIPATLVDPRKWRGNLSDKLVAERVEKITGEKFNQHITDALGMGLSIGGKL